MLQYRHLGITPPPNNIFFVGEIPLLKGVFEKFVKSKSSSSSYKTFVLRAIELVYCIPPEYDVLKVSTKTGSDAYDIRSAYISSFGGFFAKNLHKKETPPTGLYSIDADGGVVVDLNYLNNIVDFFVNGTKKELLIAGLFGNFSTSARVEGPGGLGNSDFINIVTSLFKTATDRSFLYLNIFFLNLGFLRSPALESFLDFSNILLVSSPVFCEARPDLGMPVAKKLFGDLSAAFKSMSIKNIDSYERLQALYALYFSNIPVATFAPLIKNTWDNLGVADTVLETLSASKVLTEITEITSDVDVSEIVKRFLCISYLCGQKYVQDKKSLDKKLASGTTLDQYFLLLPSGLQGALDSGNKLKSIFFDFQKKLLETLNDKIWVDGIKPIASKRRVGLEGEESVSSAGCSLQELLKQGPSFVNSQFLVPKNADTVISLLSFMFKQFPLNPNYPSTLLSFFTDSKTKSSLASISDTALELYARLVFYAVQCFVQKNCVAASPFQERPEQLLSHKDSALSADVKARDALKLALGVALGMTIFTGSVLTFKMYRFFNKKRGSK